jgi:hypothetical protein
LVYNHAPIVCRSSSSDTTTTTTTTTITTTTTTCNIRGRTDGRTDGRVRLERVASLLTVKF